ncbi:uncharacterized protein L969DRAFT_15145 [Mixia osmundae IAM 14324]|uniref:Epoxide hydrolase N-terminal domain-containing protein n=1 Tax=Mixia osmundae (strain CBS 9802 / IAM 14324 / JCM 22182 / KY 12970) TaxID=764103 RepID=G7DXS5_MIXOS|nr:uncharacterized protein L969DRAFT_15145 [Mixia osmundae IAM 14324]KEI41128.1 hypothetical protein L969DRAFT_15145 [Mixia osmundae IAM 14324]GAA95385.1 hypothetical protein E5Q_02039 [Mixia osmundae IAM 14324]
MTIRAVIFDIGGVVVGSPLAGIAKYELEHGLPAHYLNTAITARGKEGSFQRFERGKLELGAFLEEFGIEMSDVSFNNEAYSAYCRKLAKDIPSLPTELDVDGQDLFIVYMLGEASKMDPIVVNAIRRLRQSKKYIVAALSNSFEAPKSTNASQVGPPPELRALFDDYVDSWVVGMRKPDPEIYKYTLERLKIRPDEAVFLDDIGLNLKPAQDLGMKTIRVYLGKSREAIKELEAVLSMDLSAPAPESRL